MLVDDCLLVILALTFKFLYNLVANLDFLKIQGRSRTLIRQVILHVNRLLLRILILVVWVDLISICRRRANLWIRKVLLVCDFFRTWNLLKNKRISFSSWCWYLFVLKTVLFGLEVAIATWLQFSNASCRNFERKWFLSSSLVILVASNRLHLTRGHYAVHELCELGHVVLGRNISAHDFRKALALDSNNG